MAFSDLVPVVWDVGGPLGGAWAAEKAAGGGGFLALALEGFFRSDEGVEVDGEKRPYRDALVEAGVAAGAEVHEVFEGVDVGHVENATTVVVVELEMNEREERRGRRWEEGGRLTRCLSDFAMTCATCFPKRPQSQHLFEAASMTRFLIEAGTFAEDKQTARPFLFFGGG